MQALAGGMRSLLMDGRRKILNGTTTAEEIVKVAQVEGLVARTRELDELRKTAEEGQAELDELRRERDSVAARAAEAETAAAEHERRAEELTGHVAQARDRAEAAEVSAREAEAAMRTLTERVEELRLERDAAAACVVEARERAEAAEAAVERHELRACELEQAVEALSVAQAPRAPQATRHLLFVQAGARYELLERDGVPPVEGDVVELDEARYVVTKLGRSPFAHDPRPCAYLHAA